MDNVGKSGIERVAPDLVKFYSGVFLCRVCDVWTDDPEKHRHGEFLE